MQFILLLDIDNVADLEGLLAHVPDAREARHVHRLSDFEAGVRQPDVTRDRLDWPCIARALERMVSLVHAERRAHDGVIDVYVGGFAPLSAYFALGVYLDARPFRVTSIQQRRREPGRWDVLEITTSANTEPIFADVSGRLAEPGEGSGRVAVFISTQLTEPPREAIRRVVRDNGGELLAIAHAVAPHATLDADNIGRLVQDVMDLFIGITDSWPHRTGITVLLAGPASMALAAGVAMNPRQYLGGTATVDLAEYVAGTYQRVLTLPFTSPVARSPAQDPESRARRTEAFAWFREGATRLKTKLAQHEVYVPAGFATPVIRDAAGSRTFSILTTLAFPDEPSLDAFQLDPITKVLTIGHGLLDALVGLDAETIKRLGMLLTLHEVLHEEQGLGWHNYQGIGRTGVVLEDVDYWADAFAIGTASLHQIARRGLDEAERCAGVVTDMIDAHLAGLRAFDQMEQGSKEIHTLPERRLRRYLIWYLQRARAITITEPAQIRELLDLRLCVELGPLRGHLDERGDKIVDSALQTTTLNLSLGGRLRRVRALPQNLEPGEMVRAVRTFAVADLHRSMAIVVREAKDLLAGWAV